MSSVDPLGEDRRPDRVPAVDENDLNARKDGWRTFLHGIRDALQDPVKSEMIHAIGGGLMRDRVPGQSTGDQVSRAMTAGHNAGAAAQEQQRDIDTQAEESAREDYKIGQVDRGMEQKERLHNKRIEAEEAMLGRKLDHAEILARQRESAAERRHRQAMVSRANAMHNQMLRHEQTMKRMDLSDKQRSEAAQLRNDLLGKQMDLQLQIEGDKQNVKLWEIATDSATDPILGTVDYEKAQQVYAQSKQNMEAEGVPGAHIGRRPRPPQESAKVIAAMIADGADPTAIKKRLVEVNRLTQAQVDEIFSYVDGAPPPAETGTQTPAPSAEEGRPVTPTEQPRQTSSPENYPQLEEVAEDSRRVLGIDVKDLSEDEMNALIERVQNIPAISDAIKQTMIEQIRKGN